MSARAVIVGAALVLAACDEPREPVSLAAIIAEQEARARERVDCAALDDGHRREASRIVEDLERAESGNNVPAWILARSSSEARRVGNLLRCFVPRAP
jgi:hypothetical protein